MIKSLPKNYYTKTLAVLGGYMLYATYAWPLFGFMGMYGLTKTLKFTRSSRLVIGIVLVLLLAPVLYYNTLVVLDLPIGGGPRWWFWLNYKLADTVHTIFFYGLLWAAYLVIRYKDTPHSLLYIVLFLGVHTILDGCPITNTENALATKAGIELSNNQFFLGMFGDAGQLMRAVLGFILVGCLLLGLKLYKQHQLNPFRIYKFWGDHQFVQAEKKANKSATMQAKLQTAN